MKKENLKETVGGAFNGTSIFLDGLRYALSHFKILLLCFIPIFIAMSFLLVSFSTGFDFVYQLMSSSVINEARFDFFGGVVLLWIVKGLFKILTFFIFILLSYLVLQLVYIPFNSFISESLLQDKGIYKVKGVMDFIIFNINMVKIGLVKTVVVLIAGILCFMLSFFPPLAFVPIYFAFLVLAYDGFDYGLELYGFSFTERWEFFKKEFMLLNGHAGVLFLIGMVPGLLLLTSPFSVVGASLYLGEKNGLKK